MDEGETKESNIGDMHVTRTSHKVTPSFLIMRREDTAIVSADFVKYMVNPNLGVATLIFFRTYATPRKESIGWSIDTMVEESFLEIKVPLNTLYPLALDLVTVFQDLQKKPHDNAIHFGPSSVKAEPKKENGSQV